MPKATTILVVALLGAASAAQAARPLQTDDAGVLDRGDCEVEGATQRFSAAGAAERTAALQFGCGVGAATQLALAVTRSRAAGVSGSGVVLSGKTAIGSAEPALALAWSVSAAGDAGAAWRHTGTALALDVGGYPGLR